MGKIKKDNNVTNQITCKQPLYFIQRLPLLHLLNYDCLLAGWSQAQNQERQLESAKLGQGLKFNLSL